MLLATNINNTETKVGLFRGDSLEAHWRLTTTPTRTPDEWAQALTSYLTQAGRSTQEVRAAILASVVPPVTQTLCEAVERATTVQPLVVDGRSRLPITLDVEEPLSVGADRILNTLAAATVDGLVRRIKAEWPNGNTPKVVATGGLAPLVAPLSKEIESQHPDLTLVGLRIAASAL